MTLKSVLASPQGRPTAIHQNWDIPPADGAALADVYAWEEQRLNAMRVGKADPLVYVWIPQKSLSLSRREASRLNLTGFTKEPLGIRGTGGTVVPQGPGTANITLFTRHETPRGITEFYQEMCNSLSAVFGRLGLKTDIGARPGSFCDGDFNLLHQNRKLAGTAQRWCRARNGDLLGCHHVVVLTGGEPAELCSRVEALYDHARQPERYDPKAHSHIEIDLDSLRTVMTNSLADILS